MIFLAKFLIVALALVLGAKAIAFPDYVHRYRLAIEVDTPDGLKRGSSVIEVKRTNVQWLLIAHGQFEFRVRGEAVFLDLGRGKHVIALLAHGSRAEDVDRITSLGIAAYLTPAKRWNEDAWTGRMKLEGERELAGSMIPTLVAFRALDDPKSATVVNPEAFEVTFGAGYVFRRATVEMVSAGWWPANLLGLSSAPVTRTIEEKLPWITGEINESRGGRITTIPDRFMVNIPYFRRQ